MSSQVRHAKLHASFLLSRLSAMRNALDFARLPSEESCSFESATIFGGLAEYMAKAEEVPTSAVNFLFHLEDCKHDSKMSEVWHLTCSVDAEIQELRFSDLYSIARSAIPADLLMDSITFGQAVYHALIEKPLVLADRWADPRWAELSALLDRTVEFRIKAARIDVQTLARHLSEILPVDIGKWRPLLDAEDETVPVLSPPPSDRQHDILQALFEREAFDIDHRMTTEDIAEAICGNGRGNADSFKRPISDLKRRHLIDTKGGSGGGVWLTAAGRDYIQQQRKL